jgi:hypothetical protein
MTLTCECPGRTLENNGGTWRLLAVYDAVEEGPYQRFLFQKRKHRYFAIGCVDCETAHHVRESRMAKLPQMPLTEFHCMDCGLDTFDGYANYYMVTDELWQAFGVRAGMLCFPCLQARVPRSIVPADFINAPVNKRYASPLQKMLRAIRKAKAIAAAAG